MSRALYIGGFGNGKKSADRVAQALEKHFEEVDPFTFAWAIENTDTIQRWAKGAHFVTHSAGRMAIVGSQPDYVHAFNSPVETSRMVLFGRTIKKSVVMGVSVQSREDAQAVKEFFIDAATELATHPVGNLKPFFKGDISKFDGSYAARQNVMDGIPEAHVSTTEDIYFSHWDVDLERLRQGGVHVVRMAGQHDELPLRPVETLDTYFSLHAK